MTVAKEKDTDLVLDRKMNLHEVDCKAIVALYGKVAEEQLEKLPENSQVLMLAVGVPGREADRMRDTLLQHTRRPAEQEQIAKLVDTLPPMAPPRHVVLEADMLARAKARILQSQDWITAREIARLGGFSETNASAQPNSWKRAGRIFAINHKGTDYFPLYGLTLDPIRPLPAMKQVLDVLSLRDPWELAFWFDAANSCLDGRRPQEVIASEADKVLAAASEDANWVANG
jgi:hypothetical protein